MHTQRGWTPLLKAISEQHLEVAKVLVAAGADLNAKNEVTLLSSIPSMCISLIKGSGLGL